MIWYLRKSLNDHHTGQWANLILKFVNGIQLRLFIVEEYHSSCNYWFCWSASVRLGDVFIDCKTSVYSSNWLEVFQLFFRSCPLSPLLLREITYCLSFNGNANISFAGYLQLICGGKTAPMPTHPQRPLVLKTGVQFHCETEVMRKRWTPHLLRLCWWLRW